MIRLDTDLRKLQAVLGGAITTNQPTAVVCYSDKENEFQKKFPVEATVSTLNNTTPVDICPAPDKVMVREIDSVHIRNNDTVSATVTVRVNDNGTNYELVEVSLNAGDTLVYTHSEGWKTFSLYGEQKAVFNYIDFAIGPYPGAERRLKWNDTDGTLDIGLKGGNVTLQVGQEEVLLVKEHDSLGIENGKVYYFYGSDGTNKTVKKAIATQLNQADRVLGIATESSTGGVKAFITTFGLVRDINTNALTEGAPVYLSAATAGEMTSTRPPAPDHAVQVGYCIRQSATVGVIFVSIDKGSHLEYLHDVKFTSLANNQFLRYNDSAKYWENTSLVAGSNISITHASGSVTIANTAGGTVTSVDVSGGTTGLTTSGGPVTTSGTITIAGTLAVTNGGTGATTPSVARTNLGLGSIATQSFSNVSITGGSIDNTTVGASTPNTGAFTTLSASGVATFSAGTASAPAITTSGDLNNGIFFPAADTIAVTTGGSERMRVTSAGDIGIGETSPYTVSGQVYATLKGSTGRGNVALTTSAADGTGVGIGSIAWLGGATTSGRGETRSAGIFVFSEGATANDRGAYMQFNTKPNAGDFAERMRITSAGYLLIGYTASNGAYNLQVNSQIYATNATIATSDGRYKEDVATLTNALSLVSALRPVSFKWKSHPVHNFHVGETDVGFIAQEVKEVLDATEYKDQVVKANTCVLPDGSVEEFLGLADGKLVPILVKAIQEQQAQISALKTEFDAYKAAHP